MAEHDQTTPVSMAAATQSAIALLESWLAARLSPSALQWFAAQMLAIQSEDGGGRQLALALGWAPRKLGKDDLALDEAELAAARACRDGFDPVGWSVDQAARVAFVLACHHGDEQAFARQLDLLADTAEIHELVALYLGMALYPGGAALEPRAREAVRSSMRPVFEAIAHRNPYPAAHFDTSAWNQMVVKTFFLDTALWPVQGLERRANPALARMLVDLAHERWAAGRQVSPELWRCVTPHADDAGFAALARVLECGADAERLAVALSLPAATGAAGAVAADLADHARQTAALRRECLRQGLSARASMLDWPMLSPA